MKKKGDSFKIPMTFIDCGTLDWDYFGDERHQECKVIFVDSTKVIA
jgi:hypothetical protein